MSHKKDRQDDNFNIYSSDYIDYRPSSSRAKRATSLQQNVIKIVSIAVIMIICLLIVSRLYNLCQSSRLVAFSESIEKIELDAITLNSELDKLTKQFTNSIKDEAPSLNEKQSQEIQLIKTNLEYATLYLKIASRFLEPQSNRLRNILEIDKSK